MADNESVYRASVEVETKDAARNMDLLTKTVDTSLGSFDNLNEAISKTQDTLGKIDPKSAQFKELSQELQGLQQRLRDTEAQSLRFTQALSQQPGIVGVVGQSIEGLRGTLKIFMANPIIAVLSAITGAFLLMKEALGKTSEGQETLNRISGAFGKILGPVMSIIEKIALPLFEKFADLLELVANGFNKFARFLGVSQEKINEASINSSEVLKKASEDEKKRQEDETKKLEEEQKKRADARKAAAEKKKQEQEKAAQEEKQRQDEAAKILLEAQLSQLTARDREIAERELRYQEELKKLKAAGITDLTAFEEEYRMDQLNINKKYDDEEQKRQDEANQKALDAQKKADDEKKKQQEETQKFLVDAEQARADAVAQIQDLQLANVAQVGQILQGIAGKSKKLAIGGVIIEQGAAIGKVIIDSARAISAATAAAAPFISNPITAVPATANLARVIAQTKISAGLSIAGIVAGAAKGIAQINKAEVPGGGGGSAGGGGSFNIPTPAVEGTSVPQIQGGGDVDPQQQILRTLQVQNTRPTRAFVVSTDVSSQQALDRRVNASAVFG